MLPLLVSLPLAVPPAVSPAAPVRPSVTYQPWLVPARQVPLPAGVYRDGLDRMPVLSPAVGALPMPVRWADARGFPVPGPQPGGGWR